MGSQSRSRTSFPASYVPFPNLRQKPTDLPIKDRFTVNEWQYLTVDQALEDVAAFARGFTLPSGSRIKLKSADALRPQNSPWIVVGASYSGLRAALLRIRNPEVVFASWASSAPVQSQINMASYFEAIERALPRNCSADWVAVTKYVDGVLMGNNTTEQIAIKRALYVASQSGPGGNTTSVEPLSDATIMAIASDVIVGVLLDPLIIFQVSGVLLSIQGGPHHTLVVRATNYPTVLRPRGDSQFHEQPHIARCFCYPGCQHYIQRVRFCHRRNR